MDDNEMNFEEAVRLLNEADSDGSYDRCTAPGGLTTTATRPTSRTKRTAIRRTRDSATWTDHRIASDRKASGLTNYTSFDPEDWADASERFEPSPSEAFPVKAGTSGVNPITGAPTGRYRPRGR